MELFLLIVGWGKGTPGLDPLRLVLKLVYCAHWASEDLRNRFLIDFPHLCNKDDNIVTNIIFVIGGGSPVLGGWGPTAGAAAASAGVASLK